MNACTGRISGGSFVSTRFVPTRVRSESATRRFPPSVRVGNDGPGVGRVSGRVASRCPGQPNQRRWPPGSARRADRGSGRETSRCFGQPNRRWPNQVLIRCKLLRQTTEWESRCAVTHRSAMAQPAIAPRLVGDDGIGERSTPHVERRRRNQGATTETGHHGCWHRCRSA